MNRNFVLDIHTHTIASGHAYGTIREMAQAAGEAGLQLLGITEHGPGIPGTVDPLYFTNVRSVPRELYGVEILHGCEMNVLNGGKPSLEWRYLKWLDYAIAGIHSLCYRNEGPEGNTDNVIACMKQEKIRFISHPDDSRTPLDYPRLVKAAKEYGVALEVNNSSLWKLRERENVMENYETMLKLCREHRVPVIVNTDAHDPSFVGKFGLAYDLLEQLEFDQDLILNYSVADFKKFIGFR